MTELGGRCKSTRTDSFLRCEPEFGSSGFFSVRKNYTEWQRGKLTQLLMCGHHQVVHCDQIFSRDNVEIFSPFKMSFKRRQSFFYFFFIEYEKCSVYFEFCFGGESPQRIFRTDKATSMRTYTCIFQDQMYLLMSCKDMRHFQEIQSNFLRDMWSPTKGIQLF